MSPKKQPASASVTGLPPARRLTLPPTHPKYRAYSGVALSMAPEAEPLMAGLIIAAAESEDSAVYLNGLGGARALNEGNVRGIQAGRRHLEEALASSQQRSETLTAGEEAADELGKLLLEPVTLSGRRISRSALKTELAAAQAAASRAEAHGDESHLEPLSPGAKGWIVTAILTVLEVVGVYAHLVNLSSPITAVVLITLAAVLGAANHWGSWWLGRAIRQLRLLREARQAANDAAMAKLHG